MLILFRWMVNRSIKRQVKHLGNIFMAERRRLPPVPTWFIETLYVQGYSTARYLLEETVRCEEAERKEFFQQREKEWDPYPMAYLALLDPQTFVKEQMDNVFRLIHMVGDLGHAYYPNLATNYGQSEAWEQRLIQEGLRFERVRVSGPGNRVTRAFYLSWKWPLLNLPELETAGMGVMEKLFQMLYACRERRMAYVPLSRTTSTQEIYTLRDRLDRMGFVCACIVTRRNDQYLTWLSVEWHQELVRTSSHYTYYRKREKEINLLMETIPRDP